MSDLFPDDPVAVQSRREAVVRGLSVRTDDPSLFDLGESFNAVRRGVYIADEGLSALGSRLANIPNTALETPSYFHQSEAQHRLTDPTSYQRTDLAAWLDEQVAVNRREIRRITPDPTTLSQTQQILSGVIQPLTAGLVGAPLGPAGPALTLGASFGAQSYDEQIESGVDPETAERVAIGQAGIGAVMGVLPASIPIKGARFALWPALGRAASGAAINVGTGIVMRQSVHDTLMASENGDYSTQAERYLALDGQALMVDAILGAAFGTIFAHVDSGGTAPRGRGEDGGPVADGVDGEPIAPILSGGGHLDAAIEAYNDGDLVLARAHALMADRLGEQEGAFLAEQWAREGGEEAAVEGDALGFMMAAERGLIKPTPEQVQAAMVMGDDLHARVTTAPGIPLNVHADVVHAENLRAYDEAASNGEEFPQARWSEEDAANFAPRPEAEGLGDAETAISQVLDQEGFSDLAREIESRRERIRQMGGEIPHDDAYFSRRLAESNSTSRRSESEQYGDAYRILADIESAIRKGEPVSVREAAQRLGIDPNSAHAQLSQIRNGVRRPDLAAHLARVEETLVAQAMAREAQRVDLADQVRAADEGLSMSQAAARLGLTDGQVAGIVQRNLGINFRGKRGPKQNDAAHARDAQWLAENEAGESFATIGARNNVSRATIAGGVRRARIRRGQATDTAPDFAAMAERLGIPEERVRAIAARREDAQFSQRPIFESAVERVIADSTTSRASGAQWWSTISRASGVKREELQWIGLEDYLKAQEGQVSREDVLAFVRENGVTVEETVLSGDGMQTPEEAAIMQREALPLIEERDRLRREEEDLRQRDYDQFSDAEKARIREIASRQDAIEAALDEVQARMDRVSSDGQTKWSQYTLPGGTAYRELLLRLPEFANEPTPVAWKVRASGERFEVYDANNPGTEGIHYAEDRAKAEVLRGRFQRAERETTGGVRQKDTNFHSSHFDQPNILAHVRFNERTDAEGKRTLFIEEVQSDWHQGGREGGYKGDDTPIVAEIRSVVGEQHWKDESFGYATPEDLLADARQGGGPRKDAYDALEESGVDQAKIKEILALADRAGRVPDAPFKNNAWASLSMKRMIRWAAENGFDQIAWTRGQHQIERFSLAREMSRLYYNPTTKEFIGQARGGGQHREQNVSASRLAELLGTEASKQLLDAPLNRDGEHEIAAGDIKVGGEGMRAFYDKILPNIANDLGKKFGARVGETAVEARPNDLQEGWSRWEIENTTTGKVWHSFDAQSKADAERQFTALTQSPAYRSWKNVLREADFAETVHSLPITPEMRDSAMDSQALFSRDQGGEQLLTPEDFIATAERELGSTWDKLSTASGVLVARNVDELRSVFQANGLNRLAGRLTGAEKGVYLPSLRTTFLIAHNIRPDEIRGLMLHEIGWHSNIREFLGDKLYNEISRSIGRMAEEGHPLVMEAMARAEAGSFGRTREGRRANLIEERGAYLVELADLPENALFGTLEDTSGIRQRLDQARANQGRVLSGKAEQADRALAWLMENAPDLPIITRTLARLRQWLISKFGQQFSDTLTVEDIRQIAMLSLEDASNRAVRESAEMVDVSPLVERMAASKGPDAGPSQAGRDAEIAAAEDHFERMRRIGSAYDVSLAEQRLAASRSASPDGRPVQAGRDPGTYRDLDLGDGNVVNFRAVESDPMHREIHWDISDVRGYGDDVEALAQQERDIRRRLDFTPGLRSTEEGQALQRQVSEIAARRREAQVSDGAGSKSYVHAFRAVERALNEELSANAGRGVTYEFYPDKAGLQPIYEAWARRFQHPDYRIEKAEVGYRLVPTNSSRAGPNAGDFPQFSFGGRKARTAENYQRIRAEEMESAGADRDAIWRETGWARGDDGFWRFEIDTGEAALKFGELKPVEFSETQRLSEVLEFPSLFEAYPQLRNLRVDIAKGKMRGMWTNAEVDPIPGIMDRRVRLRMIVVRAESKGTALSVLLHEVQHAIQDVEGFAQGTSADVVGWDAYARSAGEIEANDVQARLGMTNVERANTPPGSSATVAKPDRIVSLSAPGDAFSVSPPEPRQNADNLVGAKRDPIESPEYQQRLRALRESDSGQGRASQAEAGRTGSVRGVAGEPAVRGDGKLSAAALQDVLAVSGIHIATKEGGKLPGAFGEYTAIIDTPFASEADASLQAARGADGGPTLIDFDLIDGSNPKDTRLPGVHIRLSRLNDGAKGVKAGVWFYRHMIEWADRQGLPVYSDSLSVSKDAQNVYDALRRRGYDVERLGRPRRAPDDSLLSTDGTPVYRVSRRGEIDEQLTGAPLPREDYQIDGPTLRERQQRINDQRAREDEYQKKSPIEQALADEPEMKLSMGRGRSVKASEAIEMSVEAQREAVAKKKAFEAAVRCAVRHGGSMAARSFITMTGRGATQAASASQLLGQGLGLTLAGPAAYAASHLARQNADPRGYAADRARMQALNVQDVERKYERGAHEAALAAGLDAPSAYEEPMGGQSVSDLANAPGEDSGDVPQPLADPTLTSERNPLETYPTPSTGETPGAIMRDGVQVARNDAGIAPVGPEALPETPSTEELLRVMGPIIRNGPRGKDN